jgi:hypothetical protein
MRTARYAVFGSAMDQRGQGVLFLPYQADQIPALRSIVSTRMRLAIFQTLCLGEGDARLWFAIDELDAWEPIDALSDALPRLRKFGGRCALGFQSIAFDFSLTRAAENLDRFLLRSGAGALQLDGYGLYTSVVQKRPGITFMRPLVQSCLGRRRRYASSWPVPALRMQDHLAAVSSVEVPQ